MHSSIERFLVILLHALLIKKENFAGFYHNNHQISLLRIKQMVHIFVLLFSCVINIKKPICFHLLICTCTPKTSIYTSTATEETQMDKHGNSGCSHSNKENPFIYKDEHHITKSIEIITPTRSLALVCSLIRDIKFIQDSG